MSAVAIGPGIAALFDYSFGLTEGGRGLDLALIVPIFVVVLVVVAGVATALVESDLFRSARLVRWFVVAAALVMLVLAFWRGTAAS